MPPPASRPTLGIGSAVLIQIACGALLGCIAAAWTGAAYLAAFGLVFGAIVGLILSPIAIALLRPDERSRGITVALICAAIGILLIPTPRLIGPAFVSAIGGWIGALVIMRLTMHTALTSGSESRFVVRALPLIAITVAAFGAIHLARSWPTATDPASALIVVDHAFRSNAMEVHPLGRGAFTMISEADAEVLSRDPDDRVRYQVAIALSLGQSDEFARATLDRLATDTDWLTRLEAYRSMASRWPDEVDAVATRMRTDADPNIRESADELLRTYGR